jgi:hypothetical protein
MTTFPRASVLPAALLAMMALAATMPAHSQESSAPNIIVTADDADAGAQRQGAFQRFNARLSRSQAPLVSVGAGNHSISLKADVPTSGYYRVFVWFPQLRGNASAVQVTVHGTGHDATINIDEYSRPGQWIPLGIFEFSNNALVTVAGGPGATVVADAVRLQYMGAQMPPLAFESDALPVAAIGEPYDGWFDLVGGTAPFTFVSDTSRLPPGLALDARTGTISGVATNAGTYSFDVEAVDHSGQRAVRTFKIQVVPGACAAAKSGAKSAARAERPATTLAKDGVSSGTPPDLSNLLGQVAALPEGEWLRANLNSYSDVWTPPDQRPLFGSSNPSPYKIIVPWSSFAWDPNRGDLWLFGGGHMNYSGNDVYRWRASTQMWERASLPSEIKQDDLGNWQAIDGWDNAPGSAHTYDTNSFFPHIDRFVVFGGAAYNSGAAWSREVTPTSRRLTGPFFFDPSKADPNKVGGTTGSQVQRVAGYGGIVGGNMWTNRDMFVNIPNFPIILSQVNGCTAYANENGKDVAYIGGRSGGSTNLNLYKYTVNDLSNPAGDTFQQVGTFWNGTAGLTTCAIDPVRKLFVRTGFNTAPFIYWNLANPGANNKDARISVVDPTGEFGTLLSSNAINMQYCAIDFDPMRNVFDLWCGDGRVWTLTPPNPVSPSGWTIVKQRTPGLATPTGDVGTGLLGKWKYVPNLDAFIGLQDPVNGNVWIYKPVGWVNPSGGTPPNPPTNVSASDGTSTSGVTVTWNSVPGASSYTIYRSTASGTQGGHVGTSTTGSFTDTTVARGTIYYYGVTATGAGGVSALSAQDSGYAALLNTGGSLSGSATLPSIVDLTATGTTDWVHWLPLVRKQSGGLISDYTLVGTATATAYLDDPRRFTWTNGTPSASGSDTSGATTSGIGAGFSFTVPATTTPQTLIVYVGGLNSTGRFTAHLSDASAADYVDASVSGSGRYDGYYTITFKAGNPGQQLQITWVQSAGTGSLSLQGAALQ